MLKGLDLDEDCVIDGIRNPGEVEELKKKGFTILLIDATQKVRFERMLKRNSEKDPKSWEEFLKIEKRDLDEKDESGQQVRKCMQMADFKLINDLDVEGLNSKLTEFLNKIKC